MGIKLVVIFVMAIVIAKVIAGMETGFLIAITMMTVGAAVDCRLSGEIALIGTVALFFGLFSAPLPPHAFPYCYIIMVFLGLIMAFAIIVVLAKKEASAKWTQVHDKRRKALAT